MLAALKEMPIPSLSSTVVFVAIVVALCFALLLGVARAGITLRESPLLTRKWLLVTALGLLGWLAITGAASASGVLAARSGPPPLLLFVIASLGMAVYAAFSPLGTRLVRGVPIAALIGVQAFRLPLELVLHSWYGQGVIPVQMTYAGHNFDIVSGVLAIALSLGLLKTPEPPRKAIWAYNVLGTTLLAVVMGIAMLSSPLPIRLYLNDPPVLLAFHFPYGFIIPFCIGGALFGHLLVFRWLGWRAVVPAAKPAATGHRAAQRLKRTLRKPAPTKRSQGARKRQVAS